MLKRTSAQSQRTSDSDRSTPDAQPWSRTGEGFARGIRYLVCVFAGYLLGIAAGGLTDGPSLIVVAAVGALALWLVFSSGRKSVAHSAADAVASANARAASVAANVNNITMAGGHVVQGTPPPIEAYERDVWADFRPPELTGYEIGVDAITGARLFEVNGVIKREELLTEREAAACVPIEVQSRPDYE